MTRFFLLGLLIFSFVFSALAQKLVNGGSAKLIKIAGLADSRCLNLPKSISVCKGREDTEDGDGKFFIRQNEEKKGELPASLGIYGSSKHFFVFYGNLDKNKSAELIVTDFDSQSNGMGISFYTINIFPDFETKGFQTPLSFKTQEFGADGTFVYEAEDDETLILLTDFYGLDNISKNGTYFVGRFFRYQNGRLKPADDKSIYARRYLNSFEKERYRTEKNPRRPWLWLNSPKAQKFASDPEFSVKPSKSLFGEVEKFEVVKSSIANEDGKITDYLTTSQIIVKFSDGERKTIVLNADSGGITTEASPGKIYVETFGILPATVSLPKDLDIKTVLGNLEGKRVVLNTYEPLSFDEEKRPRYKLLFYE